MLSRYGLEKNRNAVLTVALLAGTMIAAAACGGATPAPQGAAEVNFKGKTITLIIPYGAGGPTDVFARQFANLLPKYIPGNPSVIVQNMTGGGGMVGNNFIYTAAKKDGTNIGITSGAFDTQIFAPNDAQYDMSKVAYLGGTQESHFTLVHSKTGVKSAEELAKSNAEIVVGGLRPTSGKDMSTRLFAYLLRKGYKYVTGYGGNADIKAGFLRGENNFYEESLTGYMANGVPLVEQGTAVAVGQRGLTRDGKVVRDPRQKDIPTYQEVAEKLHGASIKDDPNYKAIAAISALDVATFPIYYPPGVPEDVVATMRKAVKAVFDDPEFNAETRKQLQFEHAYISGEALQTSTAQIVQLLEADKATTDRLWELAKEQP